MFCIFFEVFILSATGFPRVEIPYGFPGEKTSNSRASMTLHSYFYYMIILRNVFFEVLKKRRGMLE